MADNENTIPSCSFCEKTKHQVKRLIYGQRGVAICDKCTRLCVDILITDTAGELGTKELPLAF